MIDHMLVNLKKYYEGKFPCYIGMNIKAPKSGLPAYYMADSPVDGADMLLSTSKPSLTPAELENKEVIAQRLNGLDDFYLQIQPAGYYSYINCWIKLSDLVKNGGVSSSLLTHVYHALHRIRNEVKSMAIMKMKYQLQDWYPGKTQNYIGKKISMTSDVANYPYEMFSSGEFNVTPAGDGQPTSGTVVAQFNTEQATYICIGTHNDSYIFGYDVADLKIQNGGVQSSPLIHVYHAFLLARKELSMANNVLKILFDKDMYIRATKGNSQLVAIGAKTTIYVSEPNNAHDNIEQHNPLLVYVTSYDNNYYRIVDFNGYPFYSTRTWGGETYKGDNWLKNDATYTVEKEQVVQIGGVLRRLLTHVEQAFTARKAVSAL